VQEKSRIYRNTTAWQRPLSPAETREGGACDLLAWFVCAGYGDVGYLSTGSPHGKLLTPNLDRAVEEGTSFTEAYAGAPVCAPSRCTLITGRHSGHATVRDNGPIMGANDTGVATVLKKAGYDTAHIGKWGLGDIGSTGDPIQQGGFDVYFGQTDQEYCHNYYPDHMNVGPNE
jgi:arylsulfatase A-like enzyme